LIQDFGGQSGTSAWGWLGFLPRGLGTIEIVSNSLNIGLGRLKEFLLFTDYGG
jgi:hypothetical protein